MWFKRFSPLIIWNEITGQGGEDDDEKDEDEEDSGASSEDSGDSKTRRHPLKIREIGRRDAVL